MMEMLSLDPSIRSSGVAWWQDDRLIAAARVLSPYTGDEHGMACLAMAATIAEWCVARGARPQVLVFEWPKVYTAAKSKGDPNDLIALAGVGMAVATTLLSLKNLAELATPLPSEWVGQISKGCAYCKRQAGNLSKKCRVCKGSAKLTPRGLLICDRLTPAELKLVPDQHDALDGVGIGLWKRGRLVPNRVFPGAV